VTFVSCPRSDFYSRDFKLDFFNITLHYIIHYTHGRPIALLRPPKWLVIIIIIIIIIIIRSSVRRIWSAVELNQRHVTVLLATPTALEWLGFSTLFVGFPHDISKTDRCR